MKAKTRKHRIFGPNCLHPQDWISVDVELAFPTGYMVTHRNITQIIEKEHLRFDREEQSDKKMD